MSMPASAFDPYREWLGIEHQEQPADCYRLLGLPRFETDPAAIARAADERMTLIRSFQMGPRAPFTQKLLNELSAARGCLLNPQSNLAYDAELARYVAAQMAAWQTGPSAPHDLQSIEPTPPPLPTLPPPANCPNPTHLPAEIAPPDGGRRLRNASILGLIAVAAVMLAVAGWALRPGPRAPQSKQAASAPRLVQGRESNPDRQPEARLPPSVVSQPTSGELMFPPQAAGLAGNVVVETIGAQPQQARWTSDEDQAVWQFHLKKPGFFHVELVYATAAADDAELDLRIGDWRKVCSLRSAGGLDQFVTDIYPLALSQSGIHRLTIRPLSHPEGDWFALRTIRLVPIGPAAPCGKPR
jgi:hypothetical protein